MAAAPVSAAVTASPYLELQVSLTPRTTPLLDTKSEMTASPPARLGRIRIRAGFMSTGI